MRRLHGESFIGNSINVDDFLISLLKNIKLYGAENVYNVDETGIFYKLIPSKTMCKNIRSGYKIFKDRISVLLCSNMTGGIKLKPISIGKFAKPRYFKGFSLEINVKYVSSFRVWITAKNFNQWLLDWDIDLVKTNRKILLVIDNCPSHRINIELKSS